ncbi:DNA-directed DNA polymerase alpha subunit pol12 [Dinochytrium kinnereticum]|nr:DNA-directed DNA polymerase alpha subunit pol12 [Dinochytrium kinnereticum]
MPLPKTPSFSRTPGPVSSPAGVMGSSPIGKPSFSFTQGSTTPTSASFPNRANRGRVEEVFNANVPLAPAASNPAPRNVTVLHNQQMAGYRYMFEKLTEMGDLVDDRIDEVAKVIEEFVVSQKHNDMQLPDLTEDGDRTVGSILSHPGQVSPEPFFTVGRVCCDSPLDDARLNDSSIMLETSRAIGGGLRVLLSFSEMISSNKPIALFPGQIIGVYGSNPTGKQIHVTKVILPPKLPQSATAISQIQTFYPADNESALAPMNVIIACGPFTMEDSLAYEPLEALTESVCSEKPDVVILLGPFVDSAHPALPHSHLSGEDIFAHVISPHLKRMIESRPKLNLILIPSTRDFCTEWVGFPQPPLASVIGKSESLERRLELGLNIRGQEGSTLHLLPNPTQFSINEVLFAISTADSLMHIGTQEWAKQYPASEPSADKPIDRIARLFRHMLDQRHLYPLSPPFLSDHFSVDQTRLNSGAVTLQATPDVLIIPSVMRHSVRSVDGCLCVNPGNIAKKKAPGTFARMCIHPMPPAQVQAYFDRKMAERGDGMDVEGEAGDRSEDIVIGHAVDKRTRVEVVKI